MCWSPGREEEEAGELIMPPTILKHSAFCTNAAYGIEGASHALGRLHTAAMVKSQFGSPECQGWADKEEYTSQFMYCITYGVKSHQTTFFFF